MATVGVKGLKRIKTPMSHKKNLAVGSHLSRENYAALTGEMKQAGWLYSLICSNFQHHSQPTNDVRDAHCRVLPDFTFIVPFNGGTVTDD